MNESPKSILQPLLVLAAIVLVTANFWLAFQSIRTLEQAQAWVQHTYQVIAQVEIIMDSAKDAETGERGYLITGDERFLEPYTRALALLPEEMDQFEGLTADNPPQREWIAEMRQRVKARLALLQKGIDLRRSGATMTQAALAVTGSGRIEMDGMRRIANDMQNEERQLLAVRSQTAKRASLRARATAALASLLDVLLLAFTLRFLTRERGMRVAAEQGAVKLAEARSAAEENAAVAQENARLADANAAEVRALNETLEERVRVRTAELEATNRELEAFSYSVSHDLRAPLRTVDGFSLALQEDYVDAVDATGKDYIHRVRGGVQRMGQLIDALLQLSRITRAELTREEFSMSEVMEQVTTALATENPERAMEFHTEPGLRANGDPKLVRVALENLLGNAVKFTSKIPRAVIEVGWDAGHKAWFVRDNGAGFDMTYAGKLFNAFNRLHGDKDFKGSGIGLATVARVVRRHHGQIWADSEVGRGATFWFTLG